MKTIIVEIPEVDYSADEKMIFRTIEMWYKISKIDAIKFYRSYYKSTLLQAELAIEHMVLENGWG